MAKEYLTHDELQHIEHTNKILQDHLELVNAVTSLTEEKIGNMISNYRGYVKELGEIQTQMGIIIKNIYASSREVGTATGKTNDILSFCDAVVKLDKLLTPELIEKLRRLGGQTDQ